MTRPTYPVPITQTFMASPTSPTRREALDGARQPLAQLDARDVAEQLAGALERGEAVAHVALRGPVRRRARTLVPVISPDRAEQLVQARASARRHVASTSPDARGASRGQQVGAHGVVHEGEVARLLAVAVDAGRLAAQAARVTKRGITAAYSLSGFWRGP